MTLTITYQNGESTCNSTPGEESPLPVTNTKAVGAEMDDAVLVDRESNRDHAAAAEAEEMNISYPAEYPTKTEEHEGDIEVDPSPVLPAPELQALGQGVLYSANGERIGVGRTN